MKSGRINNRGSSISVTGLKREDRIQVRGGNVLLGAYGTVVSDTSSNWGKASILIDGCPKPRLMDLSRLALVEQSNPSTLSAIQAIVQAVAPLANQIKTIYQPPNWQIDLQKRQDEATKRTRELAARKKAEKQHTYEQGKVKAKEALIRLSITYATQEEMRLEESSIYIKYDMWKRKNEERLKMAYWR